MYDATEYPDWTLGDFANAFRMAPEYRPDPERYKLMQYTGMKDKNGKEIYEGDILGGHPHGTASVQWDAQAACWVATWQEEVFDDEGNPSTKPASEMLFNELENCGDTWSVIGNIHENPELIPT